MFSRQLAGGDLLVALLNPRASQRVTLDADFERVARWHGGAAGPLQGVAVSLAGEGKGKVFLREKTSRRLHLSIEPREAVLLLVESLEP